MEQENTWTEKTEDGTTLQHTLHRRCPNCQHEYTEKYDDIHDETYCQECGIVLEAPPVFGLVFPGVKVYVTTEILDKNE